MTDKVELKSCHEVIDTVSVADIDSIFQGKPTDPDILTVVMKDGKRLYCDEICLLKEQSIVYVVTRCEEHSDYVEKVFLDGIKAEDYCKQFVGDENQYGRDITKIQVSR